MHCKAREMYNACKSNGIRQRPEGVRITVLNNTMPSVLPGFRQELVSESENCLIKIIVGAKLWYNFAQNQSIQSKSSKMIQKIHLNSVNAYIFIYCECDGAFQIVGV